MRRGYHFAMTDAFWVPGGAVDVLSSSAALCCIGWCRHFDLQVGRPRHWPTIPISLLSPPIPPRHHYSISLHHHYPSHCSVRICFISPPELLVEPARITAWQVISPRHPASEGFPSHHRHRCPFNSTPFTLPALLITSLPACTHAYLVADADAYPPTATCGDLPHPDCRPANTYLRDHTSSAISAG